MISKRTHMLFIFQASDTRGNPGQLQVRQDQGLSNKKEEPKNKGQVFPRDLHRYANLSFQQGGKMSMCPHCKQTHFIHLFFILNEYYKGFLRLIELFSQLQDASLLHSLPSS